MQAIWPVRLSRQVILKQIAHRLDLHVYGFGVVIEDARAYRGWIDMDTPPSGFGGVRSRQKFYGEDSGGKYDAMESVCEAAIGHMISEANVEVMDVNYEKMKTFKGEAVAQRGWSTLLSEFLGDAKTEAAAMRRRCGKIFSEMKRLCDELGGSIDIQSTRCYVDEAASAVEPKRIGTGIPDAWLENFGSRLVKLINEGTDIVGIAGGMFVCPYLCNSSYLLWSVLICMCHISCTNLFLVLRLLCVCKCCSIFQVLMQGSERRWRNLQYWSSSFFCLVGVCTNSVGLLLVLRPSLLEWFFLLVISGVY